MSAINAITKHSFLTKCQTNFLRAKKESLKANEVIFLGDFAENYQFLVQDEIQSYRWSKEYCTLNPLVVYFTNGDGNIQHNSLRFIFDDNNHDTNFAYKIQTILVDSLKENFLIRIRIAKTLLICVIIGKILIWMLNGYSLQLVMASRHAVVLGYLLNVMLRNAVYKDPYMTKF